MKIVKYIKPKSIGDDFKNLIFERINKNLIIRKVNESTKQNFKKR